MATNLTETHKTVIECTSNTYQLEVTIEDGIIAGIRAKSPDSVHRSFWLRSLDELKDVRDLCQEAIEAIEGRMANEVSAV